MSENLTRKQLIDPQLTKAGWNLHDQTPVRFEIPASHGHDFTEETMHKAFHIRVNSLVDLSGMCCR